MNEIEIDLSKCIDNFKIDKDKAKQYGCYKKIANDLSKENIRLAFENTILQSKIDKANEILEEILVVSDWEHKGRFRPVKGTTAQDVYKTIVKLNELLETPRRINYELLKEDK